MSRTKELISRRRRQILVHSAIYYRFNESIISDNTYDSWCKELVELQREFPELSSSCPYAKEFEGFDGSTGFDLPHHYPEVVNNAHKLLWIHKRRTKNE